MHDHSTTTISRDRARTRRRIATLGASVLLAGLIGPLPQAAGTAGRPDLKVVSVSASASQVRAGRALAVTDKTRNAGTARAAATYTSFVLSIDKRASRSDIALGRRKVPRLRPGKASTGRVSVTVPARTVPRSYYLLACADAPKKVRESREGNNCRVATRPVRVLAIPPPVTPPVTPPPTGGWPRTPNPLTVAYSVDEANATTERFFAQANGSMTVYGSDGNTYTLDVPADALRSDVDITMTPLASVGGLPLSNGLQAGVEILPHGLRLREAATLTITAPDPVPVDEQVPFVFHEDGEDFHEYPAALPLPGEVGDASTVRIPLWHFSSVGVGAGTDADREAVAARVPARTEAQYEQAMADLVNAERERQMAGEPESAGLDAAVENLVNGYFEDVVAPQLAAAQTDASKASTAIAAALSWYRTLLLLGGEDEARWDQIMKAFRIIFRNAIDVSYEACVTGHQLDRILWLLEVEREIQLLGMQAEFPDVLAKMLQCARFEISFGARFTETLDDSYEDSRHTKTALWDVSADPFVWGLAQAPGEDGIGSLEWNGFDYEEIWTSPCDTSTFTESLLGTGTHAGSVGAAVNLDLNAYDGKPHDPTRNAPAGRLWIWPGQGASSPDPVKEDYLSTWTGCGDSGSRPETGERWMEAFTNSPAGEMLWTGVPIWAGAQDGAILLDHRVVGDNGGSGGADPLETWDVYLTLVHAPAPS